MSNIDETTNFTPKFDANGLIPCITMNVKTGKVAMFAYMNEQSLNKTIQTGEVHYWSRSRAELWHKGATSGTVQIVHDIIIDCDQDCILINAEIMGAGTGCHTGRSSCFYRRITKDGNLEFIEN
ncbi:MAG: phosphoribosyl-AMP cyclohydrolase [Alphaproteobacteria bacterium]